jgi:hypothetical protein
MDPSQPVDKSALCHALGRLRKPGKGPDGELLAPFLTRKITGHGLRAWYVTVRRSHGIPDNQIAWEIGHTSRGQTLDEVYGGVPPHWLAGDGPKLQWMPDAEPAWTVLEYSASKNAPQAGMDWLSDLPAIGRFFSNSFSARACLETTMRLVVPHDPWPPTKVTLAVPDSGRADRLTAAGGSV